MTYMMVLYESADDFARRDNAEKGPYWTGWSAYFEALTALDVLRGGGALDAPETAKTVQVRGGETLVKDGPYADTKEQIGGYFLLAAEGLDAALDWAARCPAAHEGAVEVRAVAQVGAEA